MNVGELIEILKTKDLQSMVVVRGFEGGVDEAKSATEIAVALNVNTEWYYGAHEVVYEGYDYKDFKHSKAVQVG